MLTNHSEKSTLIDRAAFQRQVARKSLQRLLRGTAIASCVAFGFAFDAAGDEPNTLQLQAPLTSSSTLETMSDGWQSRHSAPSPTGSRAQTLSRPANVKSGEATFTKPRSKSTPARLAAAPIGKPAENASANSTTERSPLRNAWKGRNVFDGSKKSEADRSQQNEPLNAVVAPIVEGQWIARDAINRIAPLKDPGDRLPRELAPGEPPKQPSSPSSAPTENSVGKAMGSEKAAPPLQVAETEPGTRGLSSIESLPKLPPPGTPSTSPTSDLSTPAKTSPAPERSGETPSLSPPAPQTPQRTPERPPQHNASDRTAETLPADAAEVTELALPLQDANENVDPIEAADPSEAVESLETADVDASAKQAPAESSKAESNETGLRPLPRETTLEARELKSPQEWASESKKRSPQKTPLLRTPAENVAAKRPSDESSDGTIVLKRRDPIDPREIISEEGGATVQDSVTRDNPYAESAPEKVASRSIGDLSVEDEPEALGNAGDVARSVELDYAGHEREAFQINRDVTRLRPGIERTLRYFYQRPENAPGRSNWGMMHSIMVFGTQTNVQVGRKRYNAIAWIAGNNLCRGQRLLTQDARGIKAKNGVGLQGHQAQFLAVLSLCNVPADYQLYAAGNPYTVSDLIQQEMKACQRGEELTFTLIGLSHYLDTDETWISSDGQHWDFEKLIASELEQPIVGTACGGTHRLMGFGHALRKRRAEGKPITGHWLRAEKFTQDFIQYAYSLQNHDGSMSTKWFEGRDDNGDVDRKIQTTGHIVEWLLTVLPDSKLQDRRLVSAVRFLHNAMLKDLDHDWSIGPKGHALRSLAMYHQRVFKAGNPWTQMGTPTRSRVTTRKSYSPRYR